MLWYHEELSKDVIMEERGRFQYAFVWRKAFTSNMNVSQNILCPDTRYAILSLEPLV